MFFYCIPQEDPQTENSVTPNPPAATPPPVKRGRGRPPKSAAAVTPEKEAGAPATGAGRGRKRAAPAQDHTSTAATEPNSGKIPKQEDTKKAGTQRQMDLQR